MPNQYAPRLDAPVIISKRDAQAAGLRAYFTGKPCRRGHISPRQVSASACCDCIKENDKKYRDSKNEQSNYWGKRLLTKAQARAKRKGIECTITHQEINALRVKKCPIIGCALQYGACDKSAYSDNYPTLDRINPKKGYVPGNVRVISFQANRLKSNMTLEQVTRLFLYMQLGNNHDGERADQLAGCLGPWRRQPNRGAPGPGIP